MNIDEEKRKQLRETDEFFYLLIDDVLAATTTWKDEQSDFTRRCYIRSVMSFIEGNTSRFKQVSLWVHENVQSIFSAEEIVCLKEETVYLKDNGKTGVKDMHIKMLPNLRFALESYARVKNIELKLDTDGEGWNAIKAAINKRDKITHPKTIDDFKVTEGEISLFEKAVSFYRETTLPLIGS
ncbi:MULTISPECIES: hypothetical protein [Methylobacter]